MINISDTTLPILNIEAGKVELMNVSHVIDN